MAKSSERPVFLQLTKIHMPAAALASIAHRVAGIAMALGVPLAIYLLDLSLRNPAGYQAAARIVTSLPVKILLWGMLWAALHHVLNGMRVMLIDNEFCLRRESAQASARVVTAAALLGAVLLGALVLL